MKSVVVGSRCFLLVYGQSVSWYTADSQCRAVAGKLGVVTTAGVQTRLYDAALDLGGKFWIGLKESTWIWESGEFV